MISLARAKVERGAVDHAPDSWPRNAPNSTALKDLTVSTVFDREVERLYQQRDLMLRLLTVREGSCAERWGTLGNHERFKDRPFK